MELEIGPVSAYEAVTRQMVAAVADDVKEIKERINGLLFLVAGAFVIDVALRVAGVS